MFKHALCFVVVLTLVVSDVMTEDVLRGSFYRKSRADLNGRPRLGSPHTTFVSRSRLDCMRGCLRFGAHCSAVEFDQWSRICTLGYTIVISGDVQSSAQQQPLTTFYHKAQTTLCYETLGFSYVAFGDTRSCMYVSEDSLTWNDATERCKEKGAILYAMKTLDKYHILKQNRRGDFSPIRIGLTDRIGNKTFVWDNDGERFEESDPLWDIFWDVYQPHYNYPQQACVITRGENMKLADNECDFERRYSCEIPLD